MIKDCELCGEPMGDVNKNRRFCTRCAAKRRKEQNREAQRRRRAHLKYSGAMVHAATTTTELTPDDINKQIAYLAQMTQMGELFEEIWLKLFKNLVLPLHYETQNRIARLEHKISLATGGKVKAAEWWAYAVETTRRLIQNNSNHALWLIRQEVEAIFAIDKILAEKIVREAHSQLKLSQWILKQPQKPLTDWTEILK